MTGGRFYNRRLQEAAWKLVNRWRDQGKLPEPSVPSAKEHPSITCPRCGFTSYNLGDIAEGYCGQCHDWTGVPSAKETYRTEDIPTKPRLIDSRSL